MQRWSDCDLGLGCGSADRRRAQESGRAVATPPAGRRPRVAAVVARTRADHLTRRAGRGSLGGSGAASCVLDADGSDVIVLPVTDVGGEILVFAVAPTASGLVWTDAPMLDVTRRFADLARRGDRGRRSRAIGAGG